MNPSDLSALPSSITSRRRLLGWIGRGAAALVLLRGSAARPNAESGVVTGDDDLVLARLLRQAAPHIPRRSIPYRVTRSLTIPGGTTLTIEPGTHFLCTIPAGSAAQPTAVFEADGDDVSILVPDGGEAIVECAEPRPYTYAAMMSGHDGFTVSGLRARECQHVRAVAATEAFDGVRTHGEGVNTARRVVIRGGGASYAAPQRLGNGACLLEFVTGGDVRDASYVNVAHGVQWWGGNADPSRPPAEGKAATERKCRDLHIQNVSVRTASGGGIWGSMGQNVIVVDCRVEDIGDVGFDAEGSNAVTFERCTARNAHNGCFATFFLCDGVRFVDCHGIVDDKAFPLVRIYNDTQSNVDNKRVEIVGGTFECRDATGPGTIDTAMGPVRDFVLTGATLTNVRIDVAFFNMHSTRIAGNRLAFPYPLRGVSAIRAGSSKTAPSPHGIVPGAVAIEDNRIRYTASGGEHATAISLREDDFNGSAADRIRGNIVTGPFDTGIAVSNATANIGILPSFAISGNRFSGLAASATLLAVTQEGASARRPPVTWDPVQTLDSRRVGLAAALGRRGR